MFWLSSLQANRLSGGCGFVVLKKKSKVNIMKEEDLGMRKKQEEKKMKKVWMWFHKKWKKCGCGFILAVL